MVDISTIVSFDHQLCLENCFVFLSSRDNWGLCFVSVAKVGVIIGTNAILVNCVIMGSSIIAACGMACGFHQLSPEWRGNFPFRFRMWRLRFVSYAQTQWNIAWARKELRMGRICRRAPGCTCRNEQRCKWIGRFVFGQCKWVNCHSGSGRLVWSDLFHQDGWPF